MVQIDKLFKLIRSRINYYKSDREERKLIEEVASLILLNSSDPRVRDRITRLQVRLGYREPPSYLIFNYNRERDARTSFLRDVATDVISEELAAVFNIYSQRPIVGDGLTYMPEKPVRQYNPNDFVSLTEVTPIGTFGDDVYREKLEIGAHNSRDYKARFPPLDTLVVFSFNFKHL